MAALLRLRENFYGGEVVKDAPLLSGPNFTARKSWNDAVANSDGGKDVIWTTSAEVELPIRVGTGRDDGITPTTVIAVFQDRVAKTPNAYAMHAKYNGQWVRWTWRQYWNDACTYAKALIASGMKPRACTCIMGFNAPEWLIAHFGTMFANGISAGIYSTNNEEATKFIADHTESSIVACDTAENALKFIASRKKDPSFKVKTIVLWRDPVTPELAAEGVVSWQDFMRLGAGTQADAELASRLSVQQPGNACELVYTSGTTGNPKGVLLSHDNVTWLGNVLKNQMALTHEDRFVSYLPLSHIASQDVDTILPLSSGAQVYFAQPDALKGSLVETLKEVKPTVFLAVPRVWEKFAEKIQAVGAASTGLKKTLSEWAKRTEAAALKGALLNKEPLPVKFKISNAFTHLVRKQLGLECCSFFISGAAPLPRATQEYFMSLGIPICDLFGMSECTGPETFNAPAFGSFKMGSIGRAVPGTQVELMNPDSEGVGEVAWRGRNVFMGYFKNEPATRETFDMRGFMRSGDLGRVDSDGFIYITGRAKELIITAGGENVAPVPLEENIKAQSPFLFGTVQVIGDQKKFLTALCCLKVEMDLATGAPTQKLEQDTINFLRKAGSKAKTTPEAQVCPVVHTLVWEAIQRANAKAPSRAQKVQRYRIMLTDYSQITGELTPTMKLRRAAAIKIHDAVVSDLYSNLEDEKVHPGGLKTGVAAIKPAL